MVTVPSLRRPMRVRGRQLPSPIGLALQIRQRTPLNSLMDQLIYRLGLITLTTNLRMDRLVRSRVHYIPLVPETAPGYRMAQLRLNIAPSTPIRRLKITRSLTQAHGLGQIIVQILPDFRITQTPMIRPAAKRTSQIRHQHGMTITGRHGTSTHRQLRHRRRSLLRQDIRHRQIQVQTRIQMKAATTVSPMSLEVPMVIILRIGETLEHSVARAEQ
jgi:hypothetical protein